MKTRHLLVALAAVAFVPGVTPAPAAPVPPDARQPQLYYPTTLGTELVYHTGGSPVRHVVSAVERKGGAVTVTLTQILTGGESIPHEVMVVSDKGLTRTQISGQAANDVELPEDAGSFAPGSRGVTVVSPAKSARGGLGERGLADAWLTA